MTSYKRGQFITAGGGRVEYGPAAPPRRDGIRKGVFLTGGPVASPLPRASAHLDDAPELSELERKHGDAIHEIARRLEAVRAGLENIKARR